MEKPQFDPKTSRLEGWLTKKGAKIRNWKRRWFILAKGELCYFKNPKEKSPLGTITIRGSECGEATSINKKYTNTFQVVTQSRTYYMFADSPEAKEIWKNQLIAQGGVWNKNLSKLSRILDDGTVQVLNNAARKAPSPPPQLEPEKEKKLSSSSKEEQFVTYVEKEESEDSGAENADNNIVAPVDTQSPTFQRDIELLIKAFPKLKWEHFDPYKAKLSNIQDTDLIPNNSLADNLYIWRSIRAAVCAFKFLQVKPHGELSFSRLQNWVKIIGEPFEMQEKLTKYKKSNSNSIEVLWTQLSNDSLFQGDLIASSSLNQRLNDGLFRAISPEIKSPSGGCTETLMLLFSGADVNYKSLNKPVLFECMNGDNASMLKLYNEFEADLMGTWDSKEGKETLLHLACERGYVDCCRYLVEEAHLNVNFDNGRPSKRTDSIQALASVVSGGPLHTLSCSGKNYKNNKQSMVQILDILLNSGFLFMIFKEAYHLGANINLKSKVHGLTPLMLACYHKDDFFVKALIERNADFKIIVGSGFRAIDINPEFSDAFQMIIKERQKKLIEDRLKKMSSVDRELLAAVEKGDLETAKDILHHAKEEGIMMQLEDPTIKAAEMLQASILKFLLDNGANPNSSDVEGNTPLHIIYKHESKDFVKKTECIDVLLENPNSDIEQRNDEGFTPLGLAIYCENSPSLEQKLIDKGAVVVSEIQNPFILAVIKKRVDLLEKMLERGTDATDDAVGGFGIYQASLNGDLNIIELLAKNGGNVNFQDNNDCTPLHCAAVMGYHNILKFLIQSGGDVNAQAINGATPLHQAAWPKNDKCLESVRVLVENKASHSLRDKNNLTPLDTAKKAQNHQIITLLEEYAK